MMDGLSASDNDPVRESKLMVAIGDLEEAQSQLATVISKLEQSLRNVSRPSNQPTTREVDAIDEAPRDPEMSPAEMRLKTAMDVTLEMYEKLAEIDHNLRT